MSSIKEKTPIDLANEFLSVMYGDVKEGYLTIPKFTGDKTTRYFNMDELNQSSHAAIEMRDSVDVYFGIGTRKRDLGKYKRGSSADIHSIPCLWVEIDILGGHHAADDLPTREQADEILQSFHLSPSIINHSGGGLHCYWLLDHTYLIESEDDRLYMSKLMKEFQQVFISIAGEQGFHVDHTADLARVLRVPGTYNRKSDDPKMVTTEYINADSRYSIKQLADGIGTCHLFWDIAPTEEPSKNEDQTTGDDWEAQLLHELNTIPPAQNVEKIENECQFINHYVNHQDEALYSEWMAAMSIASRFENAEEVAHRWSEQHPNYDHRETDRKLKESKGNMKPRTCSSLNAEFNRCNGCQHFGNIESPISVGMMGQKKPSPMRRGKKKRVV